MRNFALVVMLAILVGCDNVELRKPPPPQVLSGIVTQKTYRPPSFNDKSMGQVNSTATLELSILLENGTKVGMECNDRRTWQPYRECIPLDVGDKVFVYFRDGAYAGWVLQ